MFIYAVCVGPSKKFELIAEPGIRMVNQHASILTLRNQVSIHEAYNEFILRAYQTVGCEGLILLHDDTRILDNKIEEKLRTAFADPSVGIVGVIGGLGHSSMPWWEGELFGRVLIGEGTALVTGPAPRDVDTVDGLFMALSPTALRSTRCDTRRYPKGFHGYDAELCAQTRARGHIVRVIDIAVHHVTNPNKPVLGDQSIFTLSSLVYGIKWQTTGLARLKMRLRAVSLKCLRAVGGG